MRTLEANLSRFMQRFNTAYTAYYNLRHHRAGHLYQGRFKAMVVEADEYPKELGRYLHLNPVRLKKYKELTVGEKAKILKEYGWSSLPGNIGLGKRDEFMTYDMVLDYMGGDNREGRRRYRDFVMSGILREVKSPMKEARGGVVLGTDSFMEWVRKEQPQVKSLKGVIPVEEIARVVGKEYGVKPEELLKARSPQREARRVLIEMSYRLNMIGQSLQEVGRGPGGIGGDAVAHTHERMQERMSNDRSLSRRIEKLQKIFSQQSRFESSNGPDSFSTDSSPCRDLLCRQ